MFYIIETRYIGPNRGMPEYTDVDVIKISAIPAMTNSSHEERIEGWCGSFGSDWATYAHGEYSSIEEAREAVIGKFGKVRDTDPDGVKFASDDDDIVGVYKPGEYAPMTKIDSESWAYEAIQAVEASTTDAGIAELVAECESEANAISYTLDRCLADIMLLRRNELRGIQQ